MLISDYFLAQELSQPSRTSQRRGLLGSVLRHIFAKHSHFFNIAKQFFLGKRLALALQNIDPLVRHLPARPVALLERAAFQEVLEDLRLEYFNQLQLASPLDFESFQLAQLPVRCPDCIPLLEQLAFLT